MSSKLLPLVVLLAGGGECGAGIPGFFRAAPPGFDLVGRVAECELDVGGEDVLDLGRAVVRVEGAD